MLNINKIALAVEPLGGVGVSPLHETMTPAVIFVTESGKAYRVDFAQALSDEALTAAAKAVEEALGEKIEFAQPTRAAPERDRAIAAAEAESKAAAVEAAKVEAAPVLVQSAEEAQRAQDLVR